MDMVKWCLTFTIPIICIFISKLILCFPCVQKKCNKEIMLSIVVMAKHLSAIHTVKLTIYFRLHNIIVILAHLLQRIKAFTRH